MLSNRFTGISLLPQFLSLSLIQSVNRGSHKHRPIDLLLPAAVASDGVSLPVHNLCLPVAGCRCPSQSLSHSAALSQPIRTDFDIILKTSFEDL